MSGDVTHHVTHLILTSKLTVARQPHSTQRRDDITDMNDFQ